MKNLELLKTILMVQSKSYDTKKMVSTITAIAKSLDIAIWEEKGNLYAVKGNDDDGTGYPCIVSHTDTVHAIIKDENYILMEGEDD